MDIQQLFFDFSVPCPSNIPNCEKLREDYKSEYEDLKKSPGCTSCMERNLRNKYIMFILSLTTK